MFSLVDDRNVDGARFVSLSGSRQTLAQAFDVGVGHKAEQGSPQQRRCRAVEHLGTLLVGLENACFPIEFEVRNRNPVMKDSIMSE